MSKIWSKIKKFYITFSKGGAKISESREVLPLENREMMEQNQKALANSQDSLTRRPVELNHIPDDGTVRLSSDDQNLLVSASSYLRSDDYSNKQIKNNIFSVEDAAFYGSVNGNTASPDNHCQYSRSENHVNPVRNFTVENSKTDKSELNQQSEVSNGVKAPVDNYSNAATSKIIIKCPYCSSQEFVKRGTRQKKREKVQLYICKTCGRTFTPFSLKGKHYPLSVILDAISYYNLGFSLEQVSKVMKKKQNIEIQPSTIAVWVEEHKELCAYHRMRPFAVKEFSPYEVIETATLAHRQLYRYRFHRAKIKYVMEDDFKHYKFYPLREFLELVPGECPHQYFQEGLRMSEAGTLKFSKTEMIVRAKENFATRLAALILQGVNDNKQRHEILQKFLLANDSVTVATEVPVYIRREDLAHMKTQLGFKIYRPAAERPAAEIASALSAGPNGTESATSAGADAKGKKQLRQGGVELRPMSAEELPKLITGHIDFLQIRNGSIHILDYKSNAAKERPIEQLTLYALALSRLTGIRVFHFKCAWFDEKDYFEFFPLHVVYKPRRGGKKVYTKEGVYNLNERADKIENLRPVKI